MNIRSLVAAFLACWSLAEPAQAHGPYTGLKSPSGEDCCGGQDCQPVALCPLPDGGDGLRLQGGCLPIPAGVTLPDLPPDGQTHACWRYEAGRLEIKCVIRGDVS